MGNNYKDTVLCCFFAVIDTTIEIYQKISKELYATQTKFYYMFNFRDFYKQIQDILISHIDSVQSADKSSASEWMKFQLFSVTVWLKLIREIIHWYRNGQLEVGIQITYRVQWFFRECKVKLVRHP